MTQFLEFCNVRDIAKENINIDFCLGDNTKTIKTTYNDINFKVELINHFKKFDLEIRTYVEGFEEPYLILNHPYALDRSGVRLDNCLSNVEKTKNDKNKPLVDTTKLNKILFTNGDEFFYENIKTGTYSFDFCFNESDLAEEGYTKTTDTVDCENEDEYNLHILKYAPENYEQTAEDSLNKLLEWYFDEVPKSKYKEVFEKLKDNRGFKALMIKENFDLTDSCPRDAAADYIENLNIDFEEDEEWD